MQKQRESGFELLRILCIAGIIFMHTFGGLNDSLTGLNRSISIFINALFNTGVTCFILISGYFSIRFDLGKLIRLDLAVIFYTLLGTLLAGDLSTKALILSCIPILSRRYWFLSCYFALCFLSIFLNKFAEKASRKTLGGAILLLLFLLSAIPTFAFFELTQDGGKGIAQMVMVYLIGRYIRMYHPEPFKKSRLFLLLSCSTLVIFALDFALSLLKGVQMGTFCRDCSLFILISSTLLLLLFRELHFKSRIINHLAGNVMPLYVAESFVRIYVLNRVFDLTSHTDSPLLLLYVAGYVLCTIVLCMAANEMRRLILEPVDSVIAGLLMKVYNRLQAPAVRLWENSSAMLLRFLQ